MLTTQRQVRAAFWDAEIPGTSRRKVKDYSGTGRMYDTDTRVAFCDFVDYLAGNGEISEALAQRVTLSGD